MIREGARIRVLLAIPNLNGGGAERGVLNLASAIDGARFEVTVFVHERWGSLQSTLSPALKTVFHSEGAYRRHRLPGLLAATLRHARHADVLVGANEGRASFLALVAARLLRKPVVCWLSNNWGEFARIASWRQRMSLRAYDQADATVACSQGVADSFASLVRLGAGKMRTIPYGMPAERIRELAAEPLDPAYRPLFAGPTVLNVARLDYQKGQEFLIDAHARLLRRGVRHELVLLGEGPLREALARQSQQLGVEATVHFLGFQANPFAFMRNATVLALSSRFEGAPLVLTEALCCGTPIVSTDCPSGPREILDGGSCGVLVETQDAAALADGLERVLTDEAFRRGLAERALARADAYDIKGVSRRWESLLTDLAHRGQPRVGAGRP